MTGRITDISLEAFVNATEDEEKVRRAIENISGQSIPEGSEVTVVEGSFGNRIGILRVEYRNKRDIEKVLDRLTSTEAFKRSLEQAEERLDRDLVYHVRFDKGSAYAGRTVLWEKGEAVVLRIKVSTYPRRYEEGLTIIRSLA